MNPKKLTATKIRHIFAQALFQGNEIMPKDDTLMAKEFEQRNVNALNALEVTANEIGAYLKNNKKGSLDEVLAIEPADTDESVCKMIASTFFSKTNLFKKDIEIIMGYYEKYAIGEDIDTPDAGQAEFLEIAEMMYRVNSILLACVERDLNEEEQNIIAKLLLTENGKKYVCRQKVKWCWESINDGDQNAIKFMLGLIKNNPYARETLLGSIASEMALRFAMNQADI